jgi:class 3 adenylate cyclase
VRRLRSGSLRARLTRTLVGIGLLSVVLLATVNFFVVRSLLDNSTRNQLETLRDLRTDAIELAVDRLLTRVSVFGTDPGVAESLGELEDGYLAIGDELTEQQLDDLAAAYEPVIGRYDAAGVDRPPIDELVPDSLPGRYVQYQYIAANPGEDRAAMVDAGDGSAYSEAHVANHEFLRSLAAGLGASDLLLVGLESGEVVYSTSKRIDLGTDVVEGPYVDSGLGVALDELSGAAVDAAVVADTTFYLPDSAAPVLHVATAVRANAEVIGAIVVTIPSARLTDIVNASGQWDLLGLGDTGDAYVVGADLRLRTVPRTWAEDPDRYLDRFGDETGDDRTAGLMEFTGSPVLLQTVDNEAVQQALDGDDFIGGVDNYLGHSTLAASAPVGVDDLGWVIVTEQQTDETQRELDRFVVSILVLLAILLPVLALVGVLLARALARPVRPLVEAAGRIADGDYDAGVPDLGRNELGDVGHQLEAVAAQLGEQEASIEAEEDRIVTMLESVLPRALVDRVRSGERELAEIVDTATVVSIALRGIPSGTEQDAVVELTSRLADEAGRLAAEHDVERGQIALQQQIFVSGRGVPGAEVEAALAFTRALLDAVPEIGREFGVDITARAGLSAGLVASGVLGSQQVSFTAWGSSVSAAIELTGRADDGQMLADGTVVDEAGARWAVHPIDGQDDVFVVEALTTETRPGTRPETRPQT